MVVSNVKSTATVLHVKNGSIAVGVMKIMDQIKRFISSLLGSSFPRNPLTYQKGGFLEILFLGVGLISNSMGHMIHPDLVWCQCVTMLGLELVLEKHQSFFQSHVILWVSLLRGCNVSSQRTICHLKYEYCSLINKPSKQRIIEYIDFYFIKTNLLFI